MKKSILLFSLLFSCSTLTFANVPFAINELKSIFNEGLTIGENGCSVFVSYNSDANKPSVKVAVTSEDNLNEVEFSLGNSNTENEKLSIFSDSTILKIEMTNITASFHEEEVATKSERLIFNKLVKRLLVTQNGSSAICQLNY